MRLRDLLAITDSYTKIYIVKRYSNDTVAIRDFKESRLDIEIIDNNFSLEQIIDAKVTYMFAFSADKKDSLQACLNVDIEL